MDKLEGLNVLRQIQSAFGVLLNLDEAVSAILKAEDAHKSNMTVLNEERAAAKAEIEALIPERDSLKAEIASLKASLKEAQKKHEVSLQELNGKYSAKAKQVEEDLALLDKRIQAATAEQTAAIEKLDAQILAKTGELQKLQTKFEKFRTNAITLATSIGGKFPGMEETQDGPSAGN